MFLIHFTSFLFFTILFEYEFMFKRNNSWIKSQNELNPLHRSLQENIFNTFSQALPQQRFFIRDIIIVITH